MAPQYVHRADEPVFVRHVELDRVAEARGARSTDQGQIVKVDHVEVVRPEQPPDLAPVDDRVAELLGRQAGKQARGMALPAERQGRAAKGGPGGTA